MLGVDEMMNDLIEISMFDPQLFEPALYFSVIHFGHLQLLTSAEFLRPDRYYKKLAENEQLPHATTQNIDAS